MPSSSLIGPQGSGSRAGALNKCHLQLIAENNFSKNSKVKLLCFNEIMKVFKPGVNGLRLRTPGFLKSLSFARRYACVCVCVPAHKGNNNQWRDMIRYRPCAIG